MNFDFWQVICRCIKDFSQLFWQSFSYYTEGKKVKGSRNPCAITIYPEYVMMEI